MKTNFNYISFDEIRNLEISPKECVAWAEYVMANKRNWELPPKISMHFGNECFFNTMPSMIPCMDLFGLKIVSRLPGRNPALKADVFLYSTRDGNLICAMDGTWITTMRTGAVAAITAKHLQKSGNREYSFVGLGNTARASLLCLDAILNSEDMTVKLLAYKNQHELFMERFKDFKNIRFEVVSDTDEFVRSSSVIFSCVTAATSLFSDEKNYQKGVLIVPVQTSGFQNCDLVFDRIYCDDIPHIAGFKNFSLYKNVVEMTDVLSGGGMEGCMMANGLSHTTSGFPCRTCTLRTKSIKALSGVRNTNVWRRLRNFGSRRHSQRMKKQGIVA